MTVELNGLAKAQTFHGLCKELLHKIKSPGIDRGFHLYPDLISIISSDYKIIFGGECGTLKKIKESFNKAFHLLNEDDDAKLIEFFIQRGSVYNAVGFDDSVYRVLVELRKSGDIIPEYSQIVVDEYQDFNRLEVEFLKLLEGKSPTLIVGDDDQAIYDFKHATPKYLRRIVGDQEALKYEKFSLPYCSRCPSVIISSIHNIVAKAKNMELLKN